MLDWIFCSGSGLLSTSIGLNAVSAHGTCTAVFVAVAAIASFGLASIRTLGKIQWTAWVGLGCILTAGGYPFIPQLVSMLTSKLSVMMVTIAVGIQDRPPTAPQAGVWVSDYKLIESPSFTKAISAVSSIVYAYAGTPGKFSLALTHRIPSGD